MKLLQHTHTHTHSLLPCIVPHKDEEQVNLDVIRSFNSFPKSKYKYDVDYAMDF